MTGWKPRSQNAECCVQNELRVTYVQVQFSGGCTPGPSLSGRRNPTSEFFLRYLTVHVAGDLVHRVCITDGSGKVERSFGECGDLQRSRFRRQAAVYTLPTDCSDWIDTGRWARQPSRGDVEWKIRLRLDCGRVVYEWISSFLHMFRWSNERTLRWWK
jgi:hypothetical protein